MALVNVHKDQFILIKTGKARGQICKIMVRHTDGVVEVKNLNSDIFAIYGSDINIETAVETTNTPTGMTAFLVPKELWEPVSRDLTFGQNIMLNGENYSFVSYTGLNKVRLLRQRDEAFITAHIEEIKKS